MSVIGTNAVFQNSVLRAVESITPQRERTVLTRQAPWLSAALAKLWDLEQTGENIPGFGDFRLDATTTTRVKQVLYQVGGIAHLPIPTISIISGGGISFTWAVGERETKYTFWPEGALTCVTERGGEIIEDEDLSPDNAQRTRTSLEWLLSA